MKDKLGLRLRNWLQQVGFVKGNPFATSEADRESRLLPEFFVDTGYYDVIWGDPAEPQTTLLFAPRGGGKSAYRVMIESKCRPADSRSQVLAVPYITCEPLITKVRNSVQVKDHLHVILRNGIDALINTLCRSEELAARFPPSQRSRLIWFCHQYAPDAISPMAVLRCLQLDRNDASPPWQEFQKRVREARLTEGLARWGLLAGSVAVFLADLVDAVPEPLERQDSLSLLFAEFVTVVQSAGLTAVYVLVDRWDEAQETANNPQLLADLLSPLLADLTLIEVPGAAFKLFLPESLQETLRSCSSVRFDRLRSYEIKWNDDLLRQMLNRRLITYSEGGVRSLAQICAPSLAESAEQQIVWWAEVSPRRLLRLGEALFLAHVHRANENDLLLTSQDWDEACRSVLSSRLPTLRIHESSSQAFLGYRGIPLSSLEHRFLLTLARSGGWCEKERLIARVWNTMDGVTDQAVSQLVRRIREKIEPSPGNPVYLITEHGLGFRLEHTVVSGAETELDIQVG